jgi:hypothetical protein
MKLSIVLELDDAAPQPGGATFSFTDVGGARPHHLPCLISANYMAQLMATFLQSPQTRERRHLEARDAIRTYDDAVAPKLMSPGATICRKM